MSEKLSHKERQLRRGSIAAYVRDQSVDIDVHAAIIKATQHFGLSESTVRSACIASGMTIPRKAQGGFRTLDILAEMIRGTHRDCDLAKMHNVSPQRINQIREAATLAGIFEAIKSVNES